MPDPWRNVPFSIMTRAKWASCYDRSGLPAVSSSLVMTMPSSEKRRIISSLRFSRSMRRRSVSRRNADPPIYIQSQNMDLFSLRSGRRALMPGIISMGRPPGGVYGLRMPGYGVVVGQSDGGQSLFCGQSDHRGWGRKVPSEALE